jgi:CubicO group peptidase (beta-lactamase class C family)
MLRRTIPLFVALLLLVHAFPARADETDDYVAAQLRYFKLPGLALVIIKNGTIVKSGGYGFADVEKRLPMTPETVLKIGSISKQFIATGIMLLSEAGRLSVDDPVSKYLPSAPPSWSAITVRHLLSHTSGIVRESPTFDENSVKSDAEVLAGVYPVPLQFTPGQRWAYSNAGYYALAEIIRTVSGMPWTDFLQQRVFTPAGMMMTAPTNVRPTLPNRARGYTGNDNQQPAPEWVALRPSGAFLSTVLDLARWEALLYTDSILSANSRQQIWTRIQLNDGTTHPYGFGWHVDERGDRRVIWHGGGLPGFASQFLRFPDDQVTVIALANGDDSDIASIANRVALFYRPK